MPDIDGIETILTLRRAYGDIPILAMSGGWHSGDNSLLTMVARLGATATLAKPFDVQELLAAIGKCEPQSRALRSAAALPMAQAVDDRPFAYLVKRHADAATVG